MTKKDITRNAELSAKLGKDCIGYINDHLAADFAKSMQTDEIAESEEDGTRLLWFLDTYIFEGRSFSKSILDVIRENGLFTKGERDVLIQWRDDSFASAFEIVEQIQGGFRIFDIAAEVTYDVYFEDHDLEEFIDSFGIGSAFYTRIKPVEDMWFFSGMQLPFKNDDEGIYGMIMGMSPKAQYRNNPEKEVKVRAVQREQYEFFVELFGADELMVDGLGGLSHAQDKFHTSWQKYKKDDAANYHMNPSSGVDDAHVAMSGEQLQCGLLIDPKDGMYAVPCYGVFKDVFLSEDLTDNEREQKFAEFLIGGVPSICYERVYKKYPSEFINTLKLFEKRFGKYPDEDFASFMDEFRPDWREKIPSISLPNERFKKVIYEKSSAGRNDPCPCGSEKKYKKCHGKN